jgi:hypothetical protein
MHSKVSEYSLSIEAVSPKIEQLTKNSIDGGQRQK